MNPKITSGASLLKATLDEFLNDDCPSLAAALAYYTVFSLPPLLIIIIVLVGVGFGEQAIRGEIDDQINSLIGARAAQQVQLAIRHLNARSPEGHLAASLGILALLFAATTAFGQLQTALNRVWQVRPDPGRSSVKSFLIKRVLSFGMIVSIAVLLLLALAVSTALSLLSAHASRLLPEIFSSWMMKAANTVIPFGFITLLFATMFKVLPDARIAWRDVWLGAAVTAVFFIAGKYFVSLYLGNSDVTSAYGAAGSLVVLLMWTYYSAITFLIGAEFTHVWTQRYGHGIEPARGAVRVIRTIESTEPARP